MRRSAEKWVIITIHFLRSNMSELQVWLQKVDGGFVLPYHFFDLLNPLLTSLLRFGYAVYPSGFLSDLSK